MYKKYEKSIIDKINKKQPTIVLKQHNKQQNLSSIKDLKLPLYYVIPSNINENLHQSLQNKSTFILRNQMGGGQSILYAEPVSDKKQGQTAVYRFPTFKDKIVESPAQNLRTMKDIVLYSTKKYANKSALGTIVKENDNSTIKYRTYGQLLEQAHQIGSAIINEDLWNTDENNPLKFVGIFSKNRAEWAVIDVACMLYKLVSIPIYDTLGDENITYVLKHVSLKTLFVNQGAVKALQKTQDLASIKTIVSFDPIKADGIKFFEQKGIQLISYLDLLAKGKQKLVDYNDAQFKVLLTDCMTFSYTSGTTGPPKGAMISHKNMASFCAAVSFNKDTGFCSTDVALSYLPLPHILERQFMASLIYAGATIVFYSGDVAKLKDDLALVKPTIFVSVPRLFSRFYDVLTAKFKEVQGYTKSALDYAVKTKLQNVTTSGQFTHKIYDPIFFKKTKQALGGNCRLMISGSAPLLPDVQNFLKICMCCPLLEGYGQTQNTGAGFITDAYDPLTRQVGGPICTFEFKLTDIPEMQYLSTDKDQNGRPSPRGEIWLRGAGVFMGYYKDEAKTKETLTEDGWLKTGDVGQLHPETRGLRIIDRKKNIFKLQQGEYVAAEKVEGLYSKCEWVDEIFLHGESTESFCITIAVPNKKKVMQFAAEKKIEMTFEQLCTNKEVRLEILKQINNTGKEGGLKGFEQARNIYLEPLPFLAKGILTNTMKIQRHEAKKLYKEAITKLYEQKELK